MRLLVCLLLWLSTAALAQTPVRYQVSIPNPASHYAEVEATFPVELQPEMELMLPVWTPGSYLIREFARQLENVTADGAPLEKVSKNRWRVKTEGRSTVTVRYRVYAREMSVRTNWIDPEFALLNGAPTFLAPLAPQITPVTGIDTGMDKPLESAVAARPYEVTLVLPAGWTSVSGLAPGGAPNSFVARDYDELVDSPILAGPLDSRTFTVGGKEHVLATAGGHGLWDFARAAKDVSAIVKAQEKMWGGLPYDRYAFLNVLAEGGGGLEHRNSTVIMGSRYAQRVRESYVHWLTLVSHEFFHLWNIKRLRPAELDVFDYEREHYTGNLWIVEGLTNYYEALLVRRAGIISDKEYLKELSGLIETVETTPGRSVQSLRQASFDAWIKFYRPDENSVNTAISYYDKGAVVGFLLDAHIRSSTRGKKSLDDAMRLAYQRFGPGKPGYTYEGFVGVLSEVAGHDMTAVVDKWVNSTAPLDYKPALALYGLRFEAPKEKPKSRFPGADEEPEVGWLGARTRVDTGRLVVVNVPRETPAYAAGLDAEDEILAIGEFRVVPDKLEDRLKQYRPGDRETLLVARRGRLVKLDLVFGRKPAGFKLEADPEAKPEQVKAREAWLKG